jgi:hypoxanthine phosphoribosyltransferase
MKQIIKYNWKQFDNDIVLLVNIIKGRNFKPDYIIGISRGGSCLATVLSYQLEVPVKYIDHRNLNDFKIFNTSSKFLVVDDINDTGTTLNLTHKSIIKTLHPEFIGDGEKIFELNNIKFLTVFDNKKSIFKNNIYAREIPQNEQEYWVVFPWEKIFMDE